MGLCQIQCRQIVNQNHTHIKPSSHRVTRSNTFYEKCTFAISVRQIDVEFWDTNILYIYIDTHITHTRAKTIDILHRTSAYLPYVVGIFVNFYIFCQLSKTKTNKKPPLFQSTILSIRPEDFRSNNNKSLCNWRKYEFFFFLSLLSNCFIYFD